METSEGSNVHIEDKSIPSTNEGNFFWLKRDEYSSASVHPKLFMRYGDHRLAICLPYLPHPTHQPLPPHRHQQHLIHRRGSAPDPHPLRLHPEEDPHPPPHHLRHLQQENRALEIVPVIQMRAEFETPRAA